MRSWLVVVLVLGCVGESAAGDEVPAGLGMRGAGPAAGGTESGVGLGTVGTGVGNPGATAGPHRFRKPPRITFGNATVKGKLDAGGVRGILRRHNSQIRYCYEKTLVARPGIAGKLTVDFAIGGDGLVTTSSVTGTLEDPDVRDCVSGVVRRAQFGRPRSGVALVKYPVTFAPVK